ncbi:MAG: HAD-IB family hydrolase, partial [Actinobacteria bacterium]|nr:HAD-IB family hydrolase [Actinomycetota bacterium]
MALTAKRAAFFDVDNTLIRGSTIYFLGRGMYQRG